jgi:hypothetical protein
MSTVPFQVIDSFLLNYNLGDALLVLFAVGLVATIPLKSWQVLVLHLLTFGVLFFVTPSSMFAVDPTGSHLLGNPLHYKRVGLGLLVVSPVVYATTD